MRVLITAVGSTGDVAPYTGLGTRLVAAGHDVAIAAFSDLGNVVTAAGLEFRAVPVEGRAVQRTVDLRGNIRAMRTLIGAMDTLYDGIASAADGADVIVSHSLYMIPAACVAEALSIPMLVAPLVPFHPTGAFPPLTGMPSLGRVGNRLAHHVNLGCMFTTLSPFTRGLRRRQGLPAKGPSSVWARLEESEVPVCNAVSPAVLPRPSDWRPGVGMVGYLWPSRPAGWEPPSELVDFLAAGPPPVYVGFGSLGVGAGGRLSGLVADALRQAGLRGVVHAGWADLAMAGDDVMTVRYVPHDWLFPQMGAVVHHAGAGTTAATLRAGVPSVPVPIAFDQPVWARRLRDLGAAPTVLPYRRLSAPLLAAGIRMAFDRPEYRARAAQLAALVGSEDGAGAIMDVLERLV